LTGYRVPLGVATGEIREKGSRFHALLAPARSEEEARAVLEGERRREPGATHHCWAWRLGVDACERSSDDGEPAGTAGVPMLQVLRGGGLSDVVVVVSRWFGGTKLGKGGLARAYAGAVKAALERVEIVERASTVELAVELAYERLGALKRLVHPPEVEMIDEEYGDGVRVRLAVMELRLDELRQQLASIGARVSIR
jgi:uncharacterized YigZ family protein